MPDRPTALLGIDLALKLFSELTQLLQAVRSKPTPAEFILRSAATEIANEQVIDRVEKLLRRRHNTLIRRRASVHVTSRA